VGTRLTPKTNGRLEDYKEREGMGTAGALRHLIRAGLDATEDDADNTTARLLAIAVVSFMMGFPTIAAALGYYELAISFVAITTLALAAMPQLRTAWHALKSTLKT